MIFGDAESWITNIQFSCVSKSKVAMSIVRIYCTSDIMDVVVSLEACHQVSRSGSLAHVDQ